jgi:hypothetical protein
MVALRKPAALPKPDPLLSAYTAGVCRAIARRIVASMYGLPPPVVIPIGDARHPRYWDALQARRDARALAYAREQDRREIAAEIAASSAARRERERARWRAKAERQRAERAALRARKQRARARRERKAERVRQQRERVRANVRWAQEWERQERAAKAAGRAAVLLRSYTARVGVLVEVRPTENDVEPFEVCCTGHQTVRWVADFGRAVEMAHAPESFCEGCLKRVYHLAHGRPPDAEDPDKPLTPEEIEALHKRLMRRMKLGDRL